jgi:NDP-sugar pyrophosphorylase family protein
MGAAESKGTPVKANLASVTAVILAGGLGTRLRPVVADRPKGLAMINGRPFLTYLLDQLAAVGIQDAVLCTGYRGEQVHATLGDSYGSLRLRYSQEPSPLGTGGAVRFALPLLTSASLLVVNGDSFCEVNLEAFWAWHRTRQAQATLLLTKVPDVQRYGQVRIDADGAVVSFVEKGAGKTAGLINAGMYLVTQPVLCSIPATGAVSLERETFPAWIGHGLYGYRSVGRFLDIGTPESYALAAQFFAAKVPA